MAFSTILIANRGEIACRIIRTAERMGIRTVAVYTDADAGSLHVSEADVAVRIGDGPAASSYLDGNAVLSAALQHGAEAIHPGYGFLSENADFAVACESAGVTWIGPSPEHLRRFGQKHEARALATQLGIPLLAGTGLLDSAAAAAEAAERIGYPVMLKATAGGGGIGMQRCDDEAALLTAFAGVMRLAVANFDNGGVFVERHVRRARHVEVQIFGSGGRALVLGLRDCSAQRRHQKVIEEGPPPGLSVDMTSALTAWSTVLAERVGYRSAGTVEFVVDVERGEPAFLEVNTRLQVEHGVTELLTGVDLVEWMIREAAGDLTLPAVAPAVRGHAIEVRIYAEDAIHGGRPQSGELSQVTFPKDARVDTWIEAGTEVSPFYDPLLAKLLVAGDDRAAAVAAMRRLLDESQLEGLTTNLDLLREAVSAPAFAGGGYTTTFLDDVRLHRVGFSVLVPGMRTSVQELPGRLGYWGIGVPPSGPMDDRSFRLTNEAAGNPPETAGLEMTATGPVLEFHQDAVIAIGGADLGARLDGRAVPMWAPVQVRAGEVLEFGPVSGPGCRAYMAMQGGIDVPAYLGSRATFALGNFGGYRGRALIAGDLVSIDTVPCRPAGPVTAPPLTHAWEIGVEDGPHAAPDFLTAAGADRLYETIWTVHHHSDRTGVRLIGPALEWARPDGGEAGLHPSNIHDTTYAVGTVDLTGDMPIILGPDGPSLGGFVCPVTVVAAERWKIGQLTAGDTVRFVPATQRRDPVVAVQTAVDGPDVTYRRDGDDCVLVEYGPHVLDLTHRFRVHALATAIKSADLRGVAELAPGIRSLQVRFDPMVTTEGALVESLRSMESSLPGSADLVVPSRVVHLPLSWDDPATRLATERYMQVVRDDAPWCPWNIEFIRRINGLSSVDEVRRIVFDASYLVLGLGDVYLGAPVATPLDPRHRLVTTKYNPARTWTAENSVGIGGAYLCIYGMEGPGGYQFVGRTLQVWSRHRVTPEFSERWLLRVFDQVRFYPVSAAELLDLRRDFAAGRHRLEIEQTALSVAEYTRFLSEEAPSIRAFKARQQAAFDAERARWEASGEMARAAALSSLPASEGADTSAVPAGASAVTTPVHGVVARVAAVGDVVTSGEPVVVVEAMKTETSITSPVAGVVSDVRCAVGHVVAPGRPLVVITP